MKLAVIEAGGPPAVLRPSFPSYAGMFRDLLGEGFDWSVYDVQAGHWPAAPEAHDGYIVTGSSAGVYESDPWIGELLVFLRAARGRARLVGVCFGHQAMAQAFGGQVVKSPKGWGIGLHTYHVLQVLPWMEPVAGIAVPASHQDQVVEPPPATQVVAASAFTPYGMLAYQDHPSISIQLHPEFAPAYAQALIQNRRGSRYDDATADAAISSLDQPNDNLRVGGWIRRFLQA